MNKQNFNQSEGFPLETEVLNDMQTAYNIFNSLGNIAGDLAVISGCENNNGVISNGVVFINGEVLEFRGGNPTTTVIIVETPIKKEFENGEEKDVLFIRFATFGIGNTTYNWSDFKRPKSTIQLTKEKAEQTELEKLIQRVKQLEERPMANVPIGMIAIWGRPSNEIPKGWEEFTPLHGRMPLGFDGSQSDYDALLVPLGSRKKKLSKEHIPEFKFTTGTIEQEGNTDSSPGGGTPYFKPSQRDVSIGTSATNQIEIDFLNPCLVVHFIIYTGK
ncbi:hypothetical protein ACIPCA_12755 [Flavobacterium covae]|uniref:Uncharacterized protein n=2 Tax=Flavobacterium TaxID=237 RepID=A0A8G0P6F9_9FLAO|nr:MULTISPECIES: hypothetical protein [Flavobacterium]OWP85805.1 hypothetical protein BWK60_12185 [Flavobacterium covae]QYS89057.1 hypothetical protein JJC05_01010 [Flavobacterium davisii]